MYLLVFFSFSALWSEDKIDIWKKNNDKKIKNSIPSTQQFNENDNTQASNVIESSDKIEIQEGNVIQSEEKIISVKNNK